ncbi:MAG: gliding motility-associated C-terminal domain-containing protein [Cytophagales bacterium]|nr:gliding motility-associated C-terminal domain-containing protein [Bernardetiaceae bacterium]MDW8204820.1 gliding motility-associated C-terminal domain-containing protein [Cytophagales bacterium]
MSHRIIRYFLFIAVLWFAVDKLLAQTPNPVQQRRQEELAVLRLIFERMGGANWTGPGMPWPVNATNAASTFHTWAGITCEPNDTTGRIVRISLPSRGLTGSLPADISKLTELAELDLSDNRITGSIPNELATLPKLTNVNLSKNRITRIPSFATTTSLRTLNVANNSLAFDSFEPNVGRGFTLMPQDSIGRDTVIVLNEKDAFRFNGEIGGTANVYQWLKDGQPFGQASPNAGILDFPDVMRNMHQGRFVLRVTNRIVPGVTLFRRTVRIIVTPCFITGSRIGPNRTVYCEGSSIPTFTGEQASGAVGTLRYQWQRSTDSLTWTDVGPNSKDYRPTIIGQSIYLRRLALDDRCVTDTSNVIRVIFVPRIRNNIIESSYVYCPGDTIRTLRGVRAVTGGDGNYRYQWQSSKNKKDWFDEDATPNFRPQGLEDTTYFRRIVSDRSCSVDTSNIVRVVVAPEFGPNIVGFDQVLCPGQRPRALRDTVRLDSTTVRDTVNFRFLWQRSTNRRTWVRADSLTRADTFSVFQPRVLTQTTYFRRLVISPCTTDTSNIVTLQIAPPIEGNFIEADRETLCDNDTAAVKLRGVIPEPKGGGGAYSYIWQSSLNGRDWNNRAFSDTLDLFIKDISDTTLIRRIVKSRCFTDTSNIVQINRAFNFGENTITTNSQTICVVDKPPRIEATRPSERGRFNIQWQISPDSVNWANVDSTLSRLDLGRGVDYKPDTLKLPLQYFRRLINNGCRTDTSKAIALRVVPRLAGNRIGPITQEVCEGSPIQALRGQQRLTGGGGSYRYRWEVSNDSVRWALADTAEVFRPQGLVRTTLVRRIVQAANCSPDTSNMVQIRIINRLENNRIRDNQEICFGQIPDTLRGSVPTGGNGKYTYIWQREVSPNVWISVGAERDHFPDVVQSARFRRIVSTQCFTDTSQVVNVFVTRPIRNNIILTTNLTVCKGAQPDTIKATIPQDGTGVFEYQWQVSTNRSTWRDLPREVGPWLLPPISDTTSFYRRIVKNKCFRDTSLSVPVRVLPLPRVNAGPDTTVIFGRSVRLRATGALRYVWTPKDGLDNDSIATPLASPRVTTQYIVRGIDAAGCVGIDTVEVRVATDPNLLVDIVDVITPNGDGLNDFLHVKNIELYPQNTLIIFNRWGQELFQKRNYANDWDGTIDGKPLPTGVYFYIFRIEGNPRPKTGSFTILN